MFIENIDTIYSNIFTKNIDFLRSLGGFYENIY
nr:MAG TPA: hypothetical protein [Caudoviricetes sp.]